MRILLVDDEAPGRSFLADYLALQGHSVTQAASAEEALGVYAGASYDVVLSDIMLTGMSGIELLSEIGAMPGPHTRVILYTGSVDAVLHETAQRCGAYAFMTKPINVLTLNETLTGAMQH